MLGIDQPGRANHLLDDLGDVLVLDSGRASPTKIA